MLGYVRESYIKDTDEHKDLNFFRIFVSRQSFSTISLPEFVNEKLKIAISFEQLVFGIWTQGCFESILNQENEDIFFFSNKIAANE